MAEYIKRKAALALVQPDAPEDEKAAITIATAKKLVRDIVRRTPAADVAPVVHGRWKLLRKGDWTSVFVCSVCGRRETIAESESYNSQLKMPRKYPYCHCGAGGTVIVMRLIDALYWVYGKNECESWEWCKMLNTDMPPNGFCYLGDRKYEARNER